MFHIIKVFVQDNSIILANDFILYQQKGRPPGGLYCQLLRSAQSSALGALLTLFAPRGGVLKSTKQIFKAQLLKKSRTEPYHKSNVKKEILNLGPINGKCCVSHFTLFVQSYHKSNVKNKFLIQGLSMANITALIFLLLSIKTYSKDTGKRGLKRR